MRKGVMMQTGERLTYNVREAARLLGLSKNSVYQGVFTGEIPHIKVGRRILIPRLALERMLNEVSRPAGEVRGG